MSIEEINDIINEVYPKIRDYYNMSKPYPSIHLYPNIYSKLSGIDEMDGEDDVRAEYDRENNTISIFYSYVECKEDLIRSLIHECVHTKQSPSGMRRYYKAGYTYDNHPYEVQARCEEENWEIFK